MNFFELFEQKLPEEEVETSQESVCHLYGYGFASQRHGVLGKFIGEIGSLIDVMDPENFAIDSRNDFSRELDEEKFAPEYYLYIVILFKEIMDAKDKKS